MNKIQKLVALEDKYGAHNYKPLDVVIKKAKGVWVWDVTGKKYMDFLAAYSAVNQGHGHPRLVRAMLQQIKQVSLTSRAFRNDQLPLFCEEICKLTGFEKVLPMNSGAEGVETALKAIRKWAYKVKGISEGKAEIIVAENNFHGRTISIISFSTDAQYRDGFGPFTPGFKIVKYNNITALKEAVNEHTAAIFMEPIQGEAGVIIPDKNYLQQVRQLCDEKHILLILDEIQSGLGRTGKLFAYEHSGIKPDGVVIGKALSGGMYPMSAFLSSKEVMDVFNPGDHGSTFGGNPTACAIAREALKIIKEEKLAKRAEQLGAYALKRLQGMRSAVVKEVRGIGLWIAIDLKDDAPKARKYCEALQNMGVLCKEAHEHIIRLAPPLVITKKELDWALDRIIKCLSK